MSFPRSAGFVATVVILALTVVQLVVGTFAGLDQFAGKGFGYRLAVYPALMLVVPLVWWRRHRAEAPADLPWGAFALVMAPFLVDVTGNTVDLYDRVDWWDNAATSSTGCCCWAGVGCCSA